MRRTIALFILVLLPFMAFGQAKVNLQFPAVGRYQVWTAASFPERVPADLTEIEGKSHTLTTSAAPSDWLFAWDRDTGNVAAIQVKDVKGTWSIQASDFKYAGSISVRVEHKGDPVATAGITINDGKRPQRTIIDETAKGMAEFFVVGVGELDVEVEYLVEGKPKKTKQSFELLAKREQAQPEFTVSIADEVKTVASAATGGSREKPAGEKEPKERRDAPAGSPWGNVVMFLIALAVVAAMFYFGLQWFRKNPEKTTQALTSLGVQVPDSTAPPQAGAPVQPSPAPAPQKPEQIILGDATPGPLAGAPAGTTSSPGTPRIVRDNGDAFDVPEGSTSVGRELGLGLSLLNESTVSRNHAEIVRQGDQILVRDLGSTNGTFVNGVKVAGEQTLRPGDAVQFGSVKFRFEV